MADLNETLPGEHGDLGDSTYEFVDTDTDTESRDDNTTESVASTDFNGPDDIASLPGTEHSEDESDSENGIPALAGLDGPTDTPTVGQSTAAFQDELDRPLTQSIEFEEPLNIGVENVSVKHTVAEFDDEQTARIAKVISPHNPPLRLVATIRQTMTKQSLSVKEPLRILYVGSHSAKHDILHKIGSSVVASAENDAGTGSAGDSSQLYNVFPITAFGSKKSPEAEMMESSKYQIKVEDCSHAINLKFEDAPGKPDVIKLTVDDTASYHSVPEGNTFIVEPKWKLPHVAIFYCSDSDSLDARRTRTFTRTFMSRHKVPSIVISHKKQYEKSMSCMSLDQHAIHMCLESRDVGGSRNIIHQRFPIDLASFINIDARQMNRNLAYLTGLHETLPINSQDQTDSKSGLRAYSADVEKASSSLPDALSFYHTRTRVHWIPVLRVIGMLLICGLAAVTTNFKYRSPALESLSINGNQQSTGPVQEVTAGDPFSLSSRIRSLSTSTETRTATKTITVTKAQSPVSNSLAVLPKLDYGRTVEKIHVLPPSDVEAAFRKTTLCGAEIIGDREILIRIPTATLTSWLGRDALALNVSRNNDAIETERAYSTTDGIVLLFPKQEAYGVLNISVASSKKPKINETFQVDFGSSWHHKIKDIYGKTLSHLLGDAEILESGFHEVVNHAWVLGANMVRQTPIVSNTSRSSVIHINKQATAAASQLTTITKDVSKTLVRYSTAVTRDLGLLASETKFLIRSYQKPAGNALLKAQVKSKLAWLKLQGKHAEAQEYERKASHAIVQKEKGRKAGKLDTCRKARE